jgi:hypothetical protein
VYHTEPFTFISSGYKFTVAIAESGNLYSWGEGFEGQLGAGEDVRSRSVPGQLNTNMLQGVPVKIVSGSEHTLILTSTGNIYTFGFNAYGQLGDATTDIRWEPTPIKVGAEFRNGLNIAAGQYHSATIFEICQDGYVGPDCNLPVCCKCLSHVVFIILVGKDWNKGCNGHGYCYEPDKCTCNFMYSNVNRCASLSTQGIVLITAVSVIGAALLVGIIIGFGLAPFLHRQAKRKRAELELRSLLRENLLPGEGDAEMEATEEWFIEYQDLKFAELLSEGSFGVVFRGEYRNSQVAIKKIKDDYNNRNEFENEVKIMKSLRHPNVVLFMGACIMGDFRLIVTELMNGRSLEHAIHSKKKKSDKLHSVIPLVKKIELLLEVVRGMIYLHGLTPPVLHRDLKPR